MSSRSFFDNLQRSGGYFNSNRTPHRPSHRRKKRYTNRNAKSEFFSGKSTNTLHEDKLVQSEYMKEKQMEIDILGMTDDSDHCTIDSTDVANSADSADVADSSESYERSVYQSIIEDKYDKNEVLFQNINDNFTCNAFKESQTPLFFGDPVRRKRPTR